MRSQTSVAAGPDGGSVWSARTVNGRALLVVVAAGSLITSIGLGARSTFGLYLDPVVGDLGSDKGMFSLAIAIQNLVWGLSQPLAGGIADRFGAARVLALGGVGYAGALILMSTAGGAELFTLSAGLLIGLATGAASFSVVLAAVGRMAPPDKASFALGIVTAMGSIGQFVLIPISRSLIDTYGWRTTAVCLAAVVATIALFAWPLRGRAVDQQGPSEAARPATPVSSELRRAFRHPSYLLLIAGFFVCGFHVTFIATHLVSYGGDVGVTASAASLGLALIGLFNIAGSLAAGYLGGRRSKTRLLSTIYGLRAIVIVAFVLIPPSGGSFLAFGAAMGLLWLATVPLTGGIVASQFGTTHSGTLFGFVFLGHQLGAFIGVWMGGELADRTGSYAVVWWIAAALGVVAALIHLVIDEGPAPPAPIRVGSPRLAPIGAASVLALATVGASVGATAHAREVSADVAPAAVVCGPGPGS